MAFSFYQGLQRVSHQAWVYLFAGLVVTGGSLFVFMNLVSEVFEQETNGVDMAFATWVHTLESPAMHTFMTWITYSGTGLGLAIISLPVLAWLYFVEAKPRAFILFFIANLGGALLDTILKSLYQRERPALDAAIGAVGYSLPSGHAMGAMIFYGFLSYMFVRSKQKAISKVLFCIFCGVMILLMGISRIYLNAHYFTDVIAGYLAGTFWLTTCIMALEASPWPLFPIRKHN